jgi:hypothetical protein
LRGRVRRRPQFDDPDVVVECGREMHGDWCGTADTVDGSRERRGVVHNQQVARGEVVAEVGESAVHDATRRGDHQPDAVAADTVRLGRLDGIRRGWALEMRARFRKDHASAPTVNRSCAR